MRLPQTLNTKPLPTEISVTGYRQSWSSQRKFLSRVTDTVTQSPNVNACSCSLQLCSVLSQWPSSALHTLPYSLLYFWYSQPPYSSLQRLHCWSLHLFCFWSIYMEWPSPSSPAETISGLIQTVFSPQNYRLAMFSMPCFCLHPSLFAACFKLCLN